MDYDTARGVAIRNVYSAFVKQFVDTYRRDRPTVVLLPGGMGTQLDRSDRPYDGQPIPHLDYDTIWLDIGFLFMGDTLNLEIAADGRDKDEHFVVPHGPLRFMILAYDGVAEFCRREDYNFIVFGYDWRRPLHEGAGYLRHFLEMLRDAVRKRHEENPLPCTTLYCHSQGGLVAKLFLNSLTAVDDWCKNVVTVATPFYGTSSHQDRYYKGHSLLNLLHGARTVSRIVGTLPGPYGLLPIDHTTFVSYHGRLGLGPEEYPTKDPSGAPVDPYDRANITRWPPWVQADYLEAARSERLAVAAPLPRSVIGKVFNIRAEGKQMAVGQTWRALRPDFDPEEHPSPVVTRQTGKGDGTVPFWSASLAQTPKKNRIVTKHATDHAYLAEQQEVLGILKFIICNGRAPSTQQHGAVIRSCATPAGMFGSAVAPAGRKKVEAFVRDVATNRADRSDSRAYDARTWRGVLRELAS